MSTWSRWRRRARRLRSWIPLLVLGFLVGGAWLTDRVERPVVWMAFAVIAAACLVVLVWWVRAWVGRMRERRLVARTDLSHVDLMSGSQFEKHVAGLMRTHGYTKVTVVGGAEDGGVDVRAQAPDGRPVVVQCKRWRRPVPPNEVRAFLGALAGTYRGYAGVFVATNGFTEAAAREADGVMALVDRHGLALWMRGERAPVLPKAPRGQ